MYKKKVLGILFSLLICGLVNASTVKLNPNHPDQYTVIKGDNLWDISGRFLQSPWQWPEIWHVNPQIANPHLIYPGDIISLVYIDGKPRLVIKRGQKTVKLTPQGRIIPLDQAITSIPLDAIKQFLKQPVIVGKGELDRAPYVVEFQGEHIIAATSDSIYVRGIKDSGTLGYAVVREGNTYTDPKSGEILGYEARFVGNANLYRLGDPATLKMLSTTREVLIGDRLLPNEAFDTNFMPRAPSNDVSALILAVLDGVSQIGSLQVVVISKGSREGLKPGHVLSIHRVGATVKDMVTEDRSDTVTLPDEKVGVLMVFRTFEKLSYALVMKASRNIHIHDSVRNP